MVVPCLDCVCLVALTGWSELWLVGTGGPGTVHVGLSQWDDCTYDGHGPGPSWGSLHKGHSGRTVEADVGANWGPQDGPLREHPGSGSGAEVSPGWGVLECSVEGVPQ